MQRLQIQYGERMMASSNGGPFFAKLIVFIKEKAMPENDKPHNLTQMLELLRASTRDSDQVSVETMLEAVGRRSFGPILLLAGLIPTSPLSGVPGVPTFTAIIVFPVIVQLLLGCRYFWLPRWLLRRSLSKEKFLKGLDFLQRPARWIDRFINPRLEHLTRGVAVYGIALICACIVLLMPPLELVPFANSSSGAALSIFGLALVAHDGVLVLIGVTLCAITVTLVLTAVV